MSVCVCVCCVCGGLFAWVPVYKCVFVGVHVCVYVCVHFCVCIALLHPYTTTQVPVIATLIEMGGRVVFQNELSRNYWGDFEVNPNNRTSAASNISSGANGKSMCPCVSVCVCVRVCMFERQPLPQEYFCSIVPIAWCKVLILLKMLQADCALKKMWELCSIVCSRSNIGVHFLAE
jgi:hypothetical protein